MCGRLGHCQTAMTAVRYVRLRRLRPFADVLANATRGAAPDWYPDGRHAPGAVAAGDDWFYRIDNRACLVRGSEGGAGLPFAMAHVTYRKIRSVPISPPPRWHLLAERDCSDG